MCEDNWILLVARVNVPMQLQKFVALDSIVTATTLEPDRPDSMAWWWSSISKYSSNSAYTMQFIGSYNMFEMEFFWKAHAVIKCRLFSRLVLHTKNLTADCLAQQCWLHNPVCLRTPETALYLYRAFTIVVCHLVLSWVDDHIPRAEAFTYRTIDVWLDDVSMSEEIRRFKGGGGVPNLVRGQCSAAIFVT